MSYAKTSILSAAALAAALALATPASAQHWHGGGGWHGGGWHHGGWGPGVLGFATGAVLGGILGAQPYYDDYAYGPYAYDDGYAYGGYAIAGADPGYCAQRYRSYDPATGTYLGYDGVRHPCP